MKFLFALLFCPFSLMAQTIGGSLPQANWSNSIQITNNTHPADTNPNIPGGTYGKFVNQYQVFSGPCVHSGGIQTASVTVGGTGYVTGDIISVNGGSPLAEYKVTASSGVVSSIAIFIPVLATPYGGGYSTGVGVATTAVTGSGTGLTVHITAVYTGTAGPNCAVVQEQSLSAAYASTACTNAACNNGDSITFASVYPAGSALNGTYHVDYQEPYVVYSFTIATPGSGQTPGFYFISSTGGGGTGNTSAVQIPSSGAPAGTVNQIKLSYQGSGYTSCPTLTISEGGTPATFNCLTSAYPSWVIDTSLSASTYYYQYSMGSVAGGIAQGGDGNTWALHALAYTTLPNNYGGPSNYMALTKSTDGGHTWGPDTPLEYDGAPGTITATCGPGGNTLGCSYVGVMAAAPNGNLVSVYWFEDPTAVFFDDFFNPADCCYVIICNPVSVDCTNISNWSSPSRIPATTPPNLSPNGEPFLYNVSMTSNMPAGEMGLAIADASGYGYIMISCDDGVTWDTGTGCSGSPVLLQQVFDAGGTPGLNGTLPTIEFAVGYIGSNTFVMFDRNNIANYANIAITNTQSSGGVATYNYTGTLPGTVGNAVSITGTTNGSGAFNLTNAQFASINTGTHVFTVNVSFGNFTSQVETGAASYCTYPQLVCGPPIFGYSNNGGSTWHLAQSSLTPYHGTITTGEYGEAGMSLIDTGHVAAGSVDWWTVEWIERDQTPGANLYLMTSTINPATLISNLSSWTNANLQSLWYYTVNPIPSTPWQTMTGSLTTAFSWAAGPGNNELLTFWTTYGTYTFPAPVGTALIGIKGTSMKGTGVQ